MKSFLEGENDEEDCVLRQGRDWKIDDGVACFGGACAFREKSSADRVRSQNDSTRLLLGHICKDTVLDLVRTREIEDISVSDIVHTGFHGISCVEAGGPEPGVGCAGRGIIVALELLEKLKAVPDADVTIYDVLGDVVCGGFAMPIREGYAKEIYIVSSGELMSLYAANNIAKGIRRFAVRGDVRLAGIIGNSRNVPGEKELLEEFAERLGTHLVSFIPRDPIVNVAENHKMTVLEYAPEAPQADVYRSLAQKILDGTALSIPTPLTFEELERLAEAYGT